MGLGAATPGAPRRARHDEGHAPAGRPPRRGLDLLRRPLRARRAVARRALPRGRPAPGPARRAPAAQRAACARDPDGRLTRVDVKARTRSAVTLAVLAVVFVIGVAWAWSSVTDPFPEKADQP